MVGSLQIQNASHHASLVFAVGTQWELAPLTHQYEIHQSFALKLKIWVGLSVCLFVLNDHPKGTGDNNRCDGGKEGNLWQSAFQRNGCNHVWKSKERYKETSP